MVDENRVRLMARLAIYEQENEKEIRPVKSYSRRAYMSIWGFRAFFIGSIIYAVIVGGLMALYCVKNLDSLALDMVVNWATIAVLAYIIYIMLHVFRMRQYGKKKYEKGRKHVKNLAKGYKYLAELYRQKDGRTQGRKMSYAQYEEEY